MALFWTDTISLCCADVAVAKQWWIRVFDCKAAKAEWDDALPSDVALRLPGDDRAAIALSDRAEAQKAGLERAIDHAILFTAELKKAHEHLVRCGVAAGPIEESGGTSFFQIRDPGGNVIEICTEP